jgi:hypothetical protein
MTGSSGAGGSDTDAFDDLRFLAQNALHMAEQYRASDGSNPVRDGLQQRIDRLEKELQTLDRLREICTEEEPEKPGELDRLNPYKRGWVDNPAPAEQPANFIHGVRYYLGMLEDGDSWWHSLGHIESLCRDFQTAIDARAGKAPEPAVTDEQLAKDLDTVRETVNRPINMAEVYDLDAIHALARITATLAGRGVR